VVGLVAAPGTLVGVELAGTGLASVGVVLLVLLAVGFDVRAVCVRTHVVGVGGGVALAALLLLEQLVGVSGVGPAHVEAELGCDGDELSPVVLLVPEQLVLVGARAALDEHDLEVVPSILCFAYELEEVAVGAATRSLLLLVVEDALAEREAGATDVHHVIEVVDNFVYFAVVVSCVVCHLFTKITRLVFKCLSPFVVRGHFALTKGLGK
jgi:hypothetical protein